MTSGFPTLSAGRSRARRGSLVEFLRQAKANSGISGVFSRTKSVPHLRSGDRKLFRGSATSAILNSNESRSEESQEFPLLIISPPSPQHPSRDSTIELGALGITFPQSPIAACHSVSSFTGSAGSVSAWIDFFSQSDRHGTLHNDSVFNATAKAESTDDLTTPLEAATSSMTLMDPEVCSVEPVQDETVTFKDEQDLRFIGDDVVLKYILDGMEPLEPRDLYNANKPLERFLQYDGAEGGNHGPSGMNQEPPAAPVTDSLLDLRHRKDPLYENPPSISLITATPRVPAGQKQRSPPSSPSPSPPITLLAAFVSQNNPVQNSLECLSGVVAVQTTSSVSTPGEGSLYSSTINGIPCSAVALTRSSTVQISEALQGEPTEMVYPPIEQLTTSPTLSSMLRQVGVGLRHFFQSRRSAVKVKPDILG